VMQPSLSENTSRIGFIEIYSEYFLPNVRRDAAPLRSFSSTTVALQD